LKIPLFWYVIIAQLLGHDDPEELAAGNRGPLAHLT
jgi:hypothetical protein